MRLDAPKRMYIFGPDDLYLRVGKGGYVVYIFYRSKDVVEENVQDFKKKKDADDDVFKKNWLRR